MIKLRRLKMLDFFSIQKRKQFFLVKPVYGLGNRLRVLFSFAAIAKLTNKELYVYWGPSEGFDSTHFNDLFINDFNFNFIDINNYNELVKNARDWKNSYDVEYDESNSTPKINFNEKVDLESKFYEWNNFFYEGFREFRSTIFKLNKELGRDYEYEKGMFYKSLKPSKSIQSILNAFDEINNTNYISVHIRRGDATNSSPFNKHFLKSSDQIFLDKVNTEFRINNNIKLFLATDDESVLNFYRKEFGDNVIYYSKDFQESIWAKEKLGQVDACIELFLLSRGQKIYGTNWSTFSLTAHLLNEAPLIVEK